MSKAARAIILEDDKLLLLGGFKGTGDYFTLVGGRVKDGETIEQALVREIKEETGLVITKARHVYTEEHPAPYNEQYTYLCEVAPHELVAIQTATEEAWLNKLGGNIHTPMWVYVNSLPVIPFRTPQLHAAIIKALKDGFPQQPIKL